MKIAVMGYGTIGSGVVDVLRINKEKITKRAGEPVDVKYILDLREFPGDPMEDTIVHDYQTIVNDPEIGIVVETMGGVEPAYTFVKAMLEAGKQVATSNKNLVAAKGAELIKIARDHNVNFQFEASVGGGIPIIRPLNKCLTADEIEEITGILNGTTNYMLTKMAADGAAYDDVLKEAQEKGYAEKDPTADVEGFDASRKIAILTSLVAGRQVDFEDIPTEGISKITPEDMKYAAAAGKKIKLIATMDACDDSYFVRVAPFLVGPESPLFSVDDVMNAIMIHGNMLGDAMFYGSGAGSLPTASAVVGDLVEECRHVMRHVDFDWDPVKLPLKNPAEQEYRYFVRTKAAKSTIEEAFGEVEYMEDVVSGELGFTTGLISEGVFEEKKKDFENIISVIRVLE